MTHPAAAIRLPPSAERGVALPAVLFLVALLTLLLTSGLARVQADRQIAQASEDIARAFAIAQSGLQTYIGTRTTRPPDGDSVRINLTGGYASVVARVVRNPADTLENALYLVRSTGIVIDPSAGAVIQARRSVAQFADWQTGSIESIATLTAANGIQVRNGPAAARIVSGNDGNVDPTCAPPALPIAGSRTTSVAGNPAVDLTFLGAPPSIEEGSGTGPLIAGQTEIDWPAVLGAGFVPDFTTFQNGDMSRSIQRVSGSLTLSGSYQGSGILIVPGNLYVGGSDFYFEGIILVGGMIEFDAATIVIQGLVYSGLNEQLGVNSTRTEIGGNNTLLNITYHACFVSRALSAFTGLAPIANGWQDAWTMY